MCYTTPGLSEYVSGVILHWETLFQKDKNGKQLVDMIKEGGMIPGIKVDKGYDKFGLMGTKIGPLGHAETWDKGIDDLDKRCAEAYAQGARFAKWRNVLQIDPAQGIPSELAIDVCVKNLAHYAVICQKNGLVPIVEPEIVPNGNHSIEVCAEVTERVRAATPPVCPLARASPLQLLPGCARACSGSACTRARSTGRASSARKAPRAAARPPLCLRGLAAARSSLAQDCTPSLSPHHAVLRQFL